jgi:DNA-binding LacI/PurR family transcriptional regulator
MVRKVASIKDVAQLAGVSIATVSHVTRGTKYVSEQLTTKVLAAVSELNYAVNPVASGLKSRATRVLGVVIPNINSIFFPEILKGIQDQALASGYRLTFYNTGFDPDREVEIIRILESSWVDGIILDSLADFSVQAHVDFIAELGGYRKRIPVVSLERQINHPKIGSVRVDNYQGACVAMRHLVACGCRRIAHLAGPRFSLAAQERRRGYEDEIARHGLASDPARVVEGDFSPRQGYQRMRELIRRGPQIDGVLAANDQMAIGAMKALKEAKLVVPSEVKIIGFDNIFVTTLVEPSLTTVAVPRYQMGYEAARLLISAIESPVAKQDILLPISLVIRGSTVPDGEQDWDLLSW